MVMRYGMHAKLGHVAYEAERPAFLQVPWMPPATRDCSEDTAREIDNAVHECGYHCTGEMLPMYMCVPEDPPHNG